MKVVFLDIDGCLNTPRTWGAWARLGRPESLEPGLVARAREICQRTGARAVLSSTWRLCAAGLPGTVLALEQRGWPDARRAFAGATPKLSCTSRPVVRRREEIEEWLRAHPEVEAYAVVDDDLDAEIPGRTVFVDREVGLSDANVEQAVALLGAAS